MKDNNTTNLIIKKDKFNELDQVLYRKYIEHNEMISLYHVQTKQWIRCEDVTNTTKTTNKTITSLMYNEDQHVFELATEYKVNNTNKTYKSLDELKRSYDSLQDFKDDIDNISEYEILYMYVDVSVHLTMQNAKDYLNLHRDSLREPRVVSRTINYNEDRLNDFYNDLGLVIDGIVNRDIEYWINANE